VRSCTLSGNGGSNGRLGLNKGRWALFLRKKRAGGVGTKNPAESKTRGKSLQRTMGQTIGDLGESTERTILEKETKEAMNRKKTGKCDGGKLNSGGTVKPGERIQSEVDHRPRGGSVVEIKNCSVVVGPKN